MAKGCDLCILFLFDWVDIHRLLYKIYIYASPSSGDAHSDRQLTPNFELWVKIFYIPICFHMRIPKPSVSVRTPRKEISNHPGFVNISPTAVIEYYNMETKNFYFFFKKVEIEFSLVLKSWNYLCVVNVSSTLINDTWMGKSSRVFYHENSKILFYLKKCLTL